jgi:hypothetical protein
MKSIIRNCIWPLFIIIAASCTPSPQMYTDSKTMQQARLDYVQNNPEGKYNKDIIDGKIAKGMNFKEVTASWGAPNVRRQIEGTDYEHWIYAEKDEDTDTWRIFNLAFKQQELVYWDSNENAFMGKGAPPDFTAIPTLDPETIERENPDLIPIKKGRQ